MMTRQEVYNKVAAHLLSMKNGRAMVKVNGIYQGAYQTPEGERCAIGCLIPDNHPALDSKEDVSLLFKSYPDLNDIILPIAIGGEDSDYRNTQFLLDLQWLHDSDNNWEEGKLSKRGINQLIRIGRTKGLDVSVVEAIIKNYMNNSQ